MFCTTCGTEFPDGNRFCPNCGTAAEQAPLNETNPAYAPPAPETYEDYSAPAPEAPKNKSRFSLVQKIIAGAVCLALLICLIGLCTNWFGLNGIGNQIARAAKKTLSADNMTIDLRITDDNGNEITGFAQLAINLKKEQITFYGELDMDGEVGVIALYDGYLLLGMDGEYVTQDISDELDEFFDVYAENKDNYKDYIRGGKIDWEKLLTDEDLFGDDAEDIYDEACEYVDFKELNKSLSTLGKKLNSKSWLKKNAGYSAKRSNGIKVHTFDLDLYKLVTAVLPIFEDVFVDSDVYDEAMDSLDEMEDSFDDVEATIGFGVKGGKLRLIEGEVSAMGETYEVSLEFSDINKTKLDTDYIEDLLDDAELVDSLSLAF